MSERGAQGAAAALARQGSAYAIGVGVQAVAAAVALPFITRLITPAELGLIAAGLIISNLLAVTVDLGLARAVLRAHFLPWAGWAASGALVAMALVVAVVLGGILEVTGPAWSRIFDEVAFGPALRFALWGGVAVAVRNAVQAALRAREQVGWYLVVMVASTAGSQVVALLLLWSTRNPAMYLLGLAGGAALAAAIGLLVVWPSPAALRQTRLVRWTVRFSLPLVPAELAAVAIWFADRVIIERVLGLEAVGRYQIAYTLGAGLLGLLMGVSQAWGPVIHGAPAHERLATTAVTRATILGLTARACVALALVAPLALQLFAPSSYRPVELLAVTVIVAFAALPLVYQQAGNHLLADVGATGMLSWIGLAAVGLNIALTALLASIFGLSGAAAATLVTYLAYAAFTALVTRRSVGSLTPAGTSRWIVAATGATLAVMLPSDGHWLSLRVFLGVVVLVDLLRRIRATARYRGLGTTPTAQQASRGRG